jgi:radical SAM enzyme (TIGR01210 family)
MQHLSELLTDLSRRRAKYHKHQHPRKYVSSWMEDDVLPGTTKKTKALVVVLRTAGCSWAKNELRNVKNDQQRDSGNIIGGCTMCGYFNDCIRADQKITDDDLIFQFNNAVREQKEKKFNFVKIFTSGSFLDNSEISQVVRTKIIDKINELSISEFLFETRPEFVTADVLTGIRNDFSGNIYCAIGLESCNDIVRKYSINKGFTFSDYTKAVELCRNHEISIKTYLLLKPPFLSERDACTDILDSIQILKDRNLTDCISINPVNVQKFTLIEYLFERHEYRPPWLWSVLDILQKGSEIVDGSKINLQSYPTAGGKIRGAHNCLECDPKILGAIRSYSLENNPRYLENMTCKCRARWQDVINIENIAHSPIINYQN